MGANCQTHMRNFDKDAVLPLRGVLVLLVVLGHALGEKVSTGFQMMAYSAVAVFLFISGYGLMKKRMSSSGHVISGGFKHVVMKLLPAFLIASVFYVGVELALGRDVPLLRSLIAGASGLPIPYTWYVPAILCLYAIFYMANRLCQRDVVFIASAYCGVTCYWIITALVFRWPFFWWKAVFGFVVGMAFAWKEVLIRTGVRSHPVLIYVGAAACLFACSSLANYSANFAVRFVACHMSLAMLGAAVALAVYVLPHPSLGILNVLGRMSYELYIVHGMFVISLASYIGNAGLYVPIVMLCTLLAGGILCRLRNVVVGWFILK